MRPNLLLASVVALVSGSPVPEPQQQELEPRNLDCKAVNGALTLLKGLGAPATQFCSSYLHVPYTATQTITGATATV